MARVTTPNATIVAFQTLGKSITLRNRKEGYTVSRTSKPSVLSASALALIQETTEEKFKEWQGLTVGEKNAWIALGVTSFVSGFTAFLLESYKQQLQSLYGYARYGQNVSMDI